jgi:hypothetical protein
MLIAAMISEDGQCKGPRTHTALREQPASPRRPLLPHEERPAGGTSCRSGQRPECYLALLQLADKLDWVPEAGAGVGEGDHAVWRSSTPDRREPFVAEALLRSEQFDTRMRSSGVIDVSDRNRLGGDSCHRRNRSEAVISTGGEPGRESAQNSWMQKPAMAWRRAGGGSKRERGRRSIRDAEDASE